MLKGVHIKDIYLVDGDKLVLSRVGSLQRVVRQMIKQSNQARPSKKKRSS